LTYFGKGDICLAQVLSSVTFPLFKQNVIYPTWAHKSPRCIVLSHYGTFPYSKWGLMGDQEGDLILPSPRWIKCTIPAWPMGRMLMLR